jgi:hypothetical protein
LEYTLNDLSRFILTNEWEPWMSLFK